MQTKKCQPEGEQIMPETRINLISGIIYWPVGWDFLICIDLTDHLTYIRTHVHGEDIIKLWGCACNSVRCQQKLSYAMHMAKTDHLHGCIVHAARIYLRSLIGAPTYRIRPN